jgi:DNA-binding transcriptional LysR family regulator
MELQQLVCFVRVVEEGGFKRATARLNITQPAMSYLIKQLEDELGVVLFHRRPRGVVPTEAGRVLWQHAQQVIDAVQAAHDAVRELSDGVSGEIRIGTTNSIGTHFLPPLLWELRAKLLAVRPRLVYRSSDELIEALLNNKLDVALTAEPRRDRRLRYQLLAEDPISLVQGQGHPLYGRPTVTAADLQGIECVALSPQTPTGALITKYLERLNVSIQPVMQSDNVETLKRMVEAGMGVAFLPDMVTSDDVGPHGEPGRLGRSALDPPLMRRVFLVTWRDSTRGRAVDLFIDEVRRFGRRWRGHTA